MTKRLFGSWELTLVATFFLAVVSYSLVTPWNGGPDEVTHFFLLEYFYKFGTLPRPRIDPVSPFVGVLSGHRFQSSDFWYWGIPYVHVLGAWLTAKVFAPLLPEGLGFLGARAFNWILAAIFAMTAIALARSYATSRLFAVIATGAVLFIPQVIFVFSTFNSDAYGVTVVALALISFERVLRRPSIFRQAAFGISCGLILTTKLYFFPILVYFACVYLVSLAQRVAFWNWKSAVRIVATIAISATPILLTTFLQFGELTGTSGQFYFSELNRTNPRAGYGTCYLMCATGIVDSTNLAAWTWLVFSSFFGVLGWMNVLLPKIFYHAIFPFFAATLLVLSLARIAETACSQKGLLGGRRVGMSARLLLYWLMVAFTLFASLVMSQLTLPQPQGRYIFVAIPLLPLVLGILISDSWDQSNGPNVISKIYLRTASLAAIVLMLAGMLTAAYSGYISLLRSERDKISLPAVKLFHRAVGFDLRDQGFFALQPSQLKDIVTIGHQSTATLSLGESQVRGNIDELQVSSTGPGVLRGWVVANVDRIRPIWIVALQNTKILASSLVSGDRPDVAAALGSPAFQTSGYLLDFPALTNEAACQLDIAVVLSDFSISYLSLPSSMCPLPEGN